MPNFFERRQKAFAGFLLDERKEKKKGWYNKVYNTQPHSTPLHSTSTTTLLQATTNFTSHNRERRVHMTNSTGPLPYLVLLPAWIDLSLLCIKAPLHLVKVFCFGKFSYFSLSKYSTKNKSWCHQNFSCVVYLFAIYTFANNRGVIHCPLLCWWSRAQTKF
jgi:hypothetical protein